MKYVGMPQTAVMIVLFLLSTSRAFSAYDLEVPAVRSEENRVQFIKYTEHLVASYDRAFVDDYDGAIREVGYAIKMIPEEGIGFAERSKYYRMMNNTTLAERDFKKAITLFDQAIARYSPGAAQKTKGKPARTTNSVDAARLVATFRYQRGEAYFNFEKYRQAGDDFAAACQGGADAACSRIWEVKAIEKRGVQWVPLTAWQYYDRRRVERPSPTIVRAWVRREEPHPGQDENAQENYTKQQLEINCSTREYRIADALVIKNGGQPIADKVTGSGFARPVIGSAQSKLIIFLCSRQQ